VSIFALTVSIAMGLALVIDYRLLIISRGRGRVWTTAGVCRANVSPFACSAIRRTLSQPVSLRARWRRSLVAVGLGRTFERIGGGLCRLSRIGGTMRCQVVEAGFARGR
jgi:hypothetical protein